jgi:hypothetical protein
MTENGEESEVEFQLAPYDENLEAVAPYDKECHCIGWQARRQSKREAANTLGTSWDELRQQRWGSEERLALWETESGEDSSDEEKVEAHHKQEVMWKELTKDLKELEDKLFEAHPLKDKPDPDCEDCEDTGTYVSRYNPNSQWDWWKIGGRWDGVLFGEYRESGDGGFNFEPGHDLPEHNSRPVKELLDHDGDGNVFYPYALVDLEGKWHEKGEMGWWGIDSNVKDKEVWQEIVRKLYDRYPEAIGVLVDCHI